MNKFNTLFEDYNNYLTEKDSPCWKGHEKVKGKKDYEKGSCRKKGSKKKVVNENIDKQTMEALMKQKREIEDKLKSPEVKKYWQEEDINDLKYELKHVNIAIKDLTEKSRKPVNEAKGDQCTKATQKTSSSRKDKKWMKCAKQPDGSVKKVHWGDPNAKVGGSKKRKAAFKKRHNCSNAKKGSANALSCSDW